MDKLKEFQKYQFWVLLSVALILPLVGWIMARSGLMAAAEERTKVLDKLSGDLKAGPEDPNQDWSSKLEQINKVQDEQIRLAWLQLYANQAELMTWPENVDPEVMGPKDVEVYRRNYAKELEKVRQIVKPLDDVNGELVEEPGRLVNLPDGLMPHPDVDWVKTTPSAKQVQAAQEDLWLLASLLHAINSVNENATSQLDAPVREVVDLVLRGGSPKSGGAKSAAPSSAGGAMAAMGGMAEMMKNMQGGRSQDGMGGGAGMDAAKFNPDDEFGEQVEEKDTTKGATTTAPSPGGAMAGMAGMAEMMKNMGGGGAGRNNSTANMKRYVEEKTEWKTRGFYLEVIMDQRHVPHLVVALSNAEWPVRITRVHQADLNEETRASGTGGMAGMPGMMGGAAGRGASGMDMMKMMSSMAGGRPGAGATPRRTPTRDQDDDGPASPLGGVRPGSRPESAGRSDSMSALEDPMLVTVAIDGIFTLFNKPPEDKTAPPAGSQQQQQTLPAADGQANMGPPAEAASPGESTDEGAEAPAAGATEEAPEEKTETDAAPESPPSSDAPATDEKPAADAKPASP